MNQLEWLQDWYAKKCNNEEQWQWGINLVTLANPGWALDIDLEETELEDKEFTSIEIERSENDWVHCFLEAHTFKGRGGAENLEEIITIFKNWATK